MPEFLDQLIIMNEKAYLANLQIQYTECISTAAPIFKVCICHQQVVAS